MTAEFLFFYRIKRDILGQVVQPLSQMKSIEQLQKQEGYNCGSIGVTLKETFSPIDMKHAGCMLTHRCTLSDRFSLQKKEKLCKPIFIDERKEINRIKKHIYIYIYTHTHTHICRG